MNHIDTMKLALETLEYWDVHGKLHQPTEEAIAALREALAKQSAQGCDHCNHSLYAGTKCKNCGRVTEQAAIKRDLTPEQPAKQDIPDLIAGALGVSRGTAYDLMREALAEQPAPVQEPVDRPCCGNRHHKADHRCNGICPMGYTFRDTNTSGALAQKPVAWAIFTETGNARMWSTLQPHVQMLADAEGLTVTPLYTTPPAQPAPVQSCYCPNCEAMGKELAALKAQPAPVQEPVAYEYGEEVYWHTNPALNDYIRANGKELVYATPPAAPARTNRTNRNGEREMTSKETDAMWRTRSELPAAIRLAEHLESELPLGYMVKERAAAAELRRLHAVNTELLEALTLINIDCQHLHHAYKDRHTFDKDCPVVVRINAAIARATGEQA